jgi:alkyl hydroperoxide reductase subunit AhpC
LDLVTVRNVVLHQVGVVGQANVSTVRSTDIIVESAVVGTSRFYRLRIPREFVSQCLRVVGAVVEHIQQAIDLDPNFRLSDE